MSSESAIIFFDGVCNLCNSTVDFFITNDKKRKFRYAPLQGTSAPKYIGNKACEDLNSVVLYYNGKCYFKSQAILRALIILGFPFSLMAIFIIVPTIISNCFYDFVAKNRYKFFGQKNTCRIATPEEKELFLD